MSMSAPTKEGEPMMEINTTPLIDVMLVLLVMLIITIPPQSHKVAMDMPQSNNPPPIDVEPVVIDIEIAFDGVVFWNGQPVPSVDVLKQYFYQAAQSNPQPEIHIRPDKLAKYGFVAIVLAEAQRSGVKRIGFSGNEQYMEDQ